jgi:hypothetical protein
MSVSRADERGAAPCRSAAGGRVADSLTLREFLGLSLSEAPPDHSTIFEMEAETVGIGRRYLNPPAELGGVGSTIRPGSSSNCVGRAGSARRVVARRDLRVPTSAGLCLRPLEVQQPGPGIKIAHQVPDEFFSLRGSIGQTWSVLVQVDPMPQVSGLVAKELARVVGGDAGSGMDCPGGVAKRLNGHPDSTVGGRIALQARAEKNGGHLLTSRSPRTEVLPGIEEHSLPGLVEPEKVACPGRDPARGHQSRPAFRCVGGNRGHHDLVRRHPGNDG